MKRILTILLTAILLISCTSTKDLMKKVVVNNTEFYPIDPVEYGWTIPYIDTTTNLIGKRELIKASKTEITDFLKNQGTLVSIIENTINGELNYGASKVSSKNSYYRIVMDYTKYKNHHTKFGEAKVGVGLRLVAKVKTSNNKVNLGDLFALGLAAEANHLEGTLSVDVIGMDSKDITNILPFQSEINKTTIQNVMQALASIKAKIYDKDTDLYPHILSIKPNLGYGEMDLNTYNKELALKRDEVVKLLSVKKMGK
ncbi:hypothetical protein [Tenacibaculum soleae]|uniref:Lipoprotein n=1 Tax=Tenacibaculum soleae TaxID=447689 RepID=A0A1B9XWM3_9FLAO|nr:hypothetical protein [Tenacibaculum soleae]MDO6813710.1 hypothetical protein [Tenacibaculum soleae]OCK41952.1 hypothetical protein BA195_13290 [Tenacibaculum soleae]